MKLSNWRLKLLTWLSRNIIVNSWSLDRPDQVGQTMGFLPPLRDVEYSLFDFREAHLEATQDFFILRRMPEDLTYKDLPVHTLEGQYATLAIRLLHDFKDIDLDIIDLTLEPTSRPLKVSEIGEDIGDWLIEIVWSLKVTLKVDPEDGEVQPPFTASELNLYVWRDSLEDDLTDGASDINLRRLDFTFKTP